MTKVAIGLSVLASLAFAASMSSAHAQTLTPQRGGTLVMVLSQDPPTINPNVTNGVPDKLMSCMIYQGMVDIGGGYKAKPRLAKTWSISPDGLTYSFDLIEANWQDGKPFTSEDVKYTLQEVSAKYSSVFAAGGRAMESIETPAKDKVIIKLKQPFGPFMLSMACEQGGAILPSHLYRGTDPVRNATTLTDPVGTGPFKLAEWKRGNYLKLVRNPTYYEKDRPYLDEIIAKVITQPAARMQALQAGEVDLVSTFPASSIDLVKSDPKLKIEPGEYPPASNFLMYNIKNKPYDDKRVRHALLMATDRDFLIKNVFFNHGEQGLRPFNSWVTWPLNTDVDYRKTYPFDVAKANALLDAAGLKRGSDGKRFTVKMVVFQTEYIELTQAAVALKSMWSNVGVDVNIEALESAALTKRVFVDRDFDITMVGYTTFSDPALGISRAYVTSSIGQLYGNPTNYSNPKVDELFDLGEKATTQDERARFYREAQTILADDLPAFIIRDYSQIDAASKKLQNMWGDARGDGRYGEAWFMK